MISFRGWHRRLTLGLPTVLGLRRNGFFIPYRGANAIAEAGHRESYVAVERILAGRRDVFVGWLSALDKYSFALTNIGAAPAPDPQWTQDWFPRLDAAMAYTMVRSCCPRRIVEIGSGHSTRFFARAISDANLDTTITAIDPQPRAYLDGLNSVKVIRKPLQEVSSAPFDELAAGDILAIDSSHVLMPGSDVDMLLNRILPGLPAGVLVQVHDIFLPDDYPMDWNWRGYNEQLAIAILLHDGSGWKVEFASHYAVTRMTDSVDSSVVGRLPLLVGAHESGLWIKKV